jgi:protein-L-isoaspartate(D-aspartate) O-methyltransferase
MNAATLDIERARFNMIEQQIRPWDVLDPGVLELLARVRREDFVAPALRALAFSDMELPLRVDGTDTGEVMLAPKVEARFMQELALRPHETVLEIGTGSGYMAALAAHRAAHVVSVEIRPELCAFAAANLQRAGIRNVRVDRGDGARGWRGTDLPQQYDAIIVSGALPAVPESLTSQLRSGGRMVAIVGEAPVMHAQRLTRSTTDTLDTVTLFETLTRPLVNAWQPSRFRF